MKDATQKFQMSKVSAVLKSGNTRWDDRFFSLAKEVSSWSKDTAPHRKVGAVLVSADRRMTSLGFNGFPPGIADTERRLEDKELKRLLMVHSEVNAVRNAGFERRGSTLYCTRCPCHECAKEIICSGVTRVVAPFSSPGWEHADWGWSVSLGRELFREAKIRYDDAERTPTDDGSI